MGCGASSTAAGDVATSTVGHASADAYVLPAGADSPLHATADFARPADDLEAHLISQLGSPRSHGEPTDEPSGFVSSFRRTLSVVGSRVRHGVTDDVDQYVPANIPEVVRTASCRSVTSWLERNEQIAAAAPGAAVEPVSDSSDALGISPSELFSRPSPNRSSAALPGYHQRSQSTSVDGTDDAVPYWDSDDDEAYIRRNSHQTLTSDRLKAHNRFVQYQLKQVRPYTLKSHHSQNSLRTPPRLPVPGV